MATVATARLGLKKQDLGDNPGGWHSALNSGFDDADARFFRSGSAADPNIATTGDYVGQRYYDTTNDLWWTCKSPGSPGTWLRDATQIDAEVTHPTFPTTLAQDYTHGDLRANLVWVSDTVVRLENIGGTDIYVDISGTRYALTGPFDFDITTDLESPFVEASNTWYYLYIDDLTVPGTPEAKMSPTAPDDVAGTKPGYHPTKADWRCVGSVWNNNSGHIQGFRVKRDGHVQFTSKGTAASYDRTNHYLTLSTDQDVDWVLQALSLPLTAESAFLFLTVNANASADSVILIAESDAPSPGSPWSTGAPPADLTAAGYEDVLFAFNLGVNDWTNADFEVGIANRASPGFKYATLRGGSLGSFNALVMGYRDLWVPRGF